MGSLTISDTVFDKYFGYLKDLDNQTKKKLIAQLTKSIETEPKKKIDPHSFYGVWVDERSSDEIIQEIKAARVEKPDIESF